MEPDERKAWLRGLRAGQLVVISQRDKLIPARVVKITHRGTVYVERLDDVGLIFKFDQVWGRERGSVRDPWFRQSIGPLTLEASDAIERERLLDNFCELFGHDCPEQARVKTVALKQAWAILKNSLDH